MCVLNALRDDSKLKMGDEKRPLDVRGGGDQRSGCKKQSIFVKNAISLFPVCCHFQILNNTQIWHLW